MGVYFFLLKKGLWRIDVEADAKRFVTFSLLDRKFVKKQLLSLGRQTNIKKSYNSLFVWPVGPFIKYQEIYNLHIMSDRPNIYDDEHYNEEYENGWTYKSMSKIGLKQGHRTGLKNVFRGWVEVFLECTRPSNEQGSIEQSSLSHQVWSHKGSTFKKRAHFGQNSRPGESDPYVFY